MSTRDTQSLNPTRNGYGKNKQLIVKYIINRVEKGTGKTVSELKQHYNEEHLFYEALKHVTTTKKALCKALNINIDNACRYKRSFEKNGILAQSVKEIVCPYTGFLAHEISTNPSEFERLRQDDNNQLTIF